MRMLDYLIEEHREAILEDNQMSVLMSSIQTFNVL